ncbi:hypothetical protein B0H16DRAFT_1712474 [Mycena metata]|uniref:Uncharacterized protein n=1 Tax=Mycena metata TaxID=1033252 RepID=A0AAD7K131_9AGAR|nr:hypothetical protein B0H16DRAFT_1712474 [Mycena metata]
MASKIEQNESDYTRLRGNEDDETDEVHMRTNFGVRVARNPTTSSFSKHNRASNLPLRVSSPLGAGVSTPTPSSPTAKDPSDAASKIPVHLNAIKNVLGKAELNPEALKPTNRSESAAPQQHSPSSGRWPTAASETSTSGVRADGAEVREDGVRSTESFDSAGPSTPSTHMTRPSDKRGRKHGVSLPPFPPTQSSTTRIIKFDSLSLAHTTSTRALARSAYPMPLSAPRAPRAPRAHTTTDRTP